MNTNGSPVSETMVGVPLSGIVEAIWNCDLMLSRHASVALPAGTVEGTLIASSSALFGVVEHQTLAMLSATTEFSPARG